MQRDPRAGPGAPSASGMRVVIAGCGDVDDEQQQLEARRRSSAAHDAQRRPPRAGAADRSRPSRRARRPARRSRSAILSDCQGAFGSFDNQDMAGAVAAMSQFAGAQAEEPEQAA